ncbi:hypothetical protein I5Q34_02125 [Streptomyces sp. AV19]|uniref:DUF6415 family natural product biosynthesis protein n=1 Tax=Streptomyces sp. AV19 TaxID=2793068 RepID=UPI0018FE0D97|nr:DUF6415 family natural product biosynthesis protein [Streptomyces sp. AV19]MBH1933097.1 hypothetical protein [Streptomyces sp. AV19]MDG4531810.1 DUF6415 family natural product biosynthesis protein [Streptomyces sp. AV19]
MSSDSRDPAPPLMTLMTGETPPLDLVTIRTTIRRALQERPFRPPAHEIAELTRTLRAYLKAMLTEAQHRADQLEPDTTARDRWDALISHVLADLDFGAGTERPVRCAAQAYLEILARDARFLADCLDE